MSLQRAARRAARRGLNALRSAALFWRRPALVLLDALEVALDWAGCSEGRAAEVTQACAACMALSWLLGLLWAFWLHPVATPTAAKAVGSVVIHLDGSVAGLLWAALRCVGTLGVISLLLTHWAAASALTLSLLWPSVTLSWLLLCCTCSFLDLGTGAEDSD